MMRLSAKNLFSIKRCVAGLIFACLLFAVSCKKNARTNNFEIISSDETVEAGKLVADANQDLTKIKTLYKDNEDKREELKKTLEANDAEKVKKISDDVVYLINDGTNFGKSAIEKLEKAQEMQINGDYRDYLQLKQKCLEKQLEAFENYRQAAISLRNNYDPKNKESREKVKEEFKNRSENYRKIMETARDYSNQANILAKEKSKRKVEE